MSTAREHALGVEQRSRRNPWRERLGLLMEKHLGKGRRAVTDWINTLEHTSARLSPDDPMRAYDFGWMWRELGTAGLRI